ncbi:MAG: hypothetical protein JWN32_3245 [Solirubrobacterales bacterium]|nr:hypothetical protein [Solirubrobacterales bacterium]
MTRTTRLAVGLALAAGLAGCGAQQAPPALPPPTFGPTGPAPPSADSPALHATDLLVGFRSLGAATGVTVVRKANATHPQPAIIFFHGWGSTDANMYGPWIAHLARAGYFVIYPEYQVINKTRPDQVLATALAGVRTGLLLARLDHHAVAPGPVVTVGHSGGGVLAADYAALAARSHLPPARVVYSVYPGRKPIGGHWTSEVPLADLATMPAATQLTEHAGATDATARTGTARAIYAGATRVTRKRLTIVKAPVISDHIGPMYDYAPAHQTFWAPLDRLLNR